MNKLPFVTAHSGCMNTQANSIEHIFEAMNAGADIIEVDVRSTKDDIVVLSHDDFIDVPGYGFQRIMDIDYDELKITKPGIIRLEDALRIIREHNRIINLDVKDDAVVKPMVKTVKTTGMSDYVILSGCEKKRALYITENHMGLQVLLNSDEKMLHVGGNSDYSYFVKKTCEDAIAASCCGINIFYKDCMEELVSYASVRCLPVCVYTIDDISGMKKYMDMGVYSITTNLVKALVNLKIAV